MQLQMTHDIHGKVTTFTEETAPDWLTDKGKKQGTTMDCRWFWTDHILTLPVGGSVPSEFHPTKRIE